MRGVGTAGCGDYLIVVGEGPCHLWACGDNVPRSAGCGLRAPWTCAPVTASEGSRLPLSLERLARGGGGQDRARPPAASGPGAPTLFSHGARREHCARSLSPLLPVRGPFAFPSLSTIFWPKDPQVTGLRPRACANPKTKGAAVRLLGPLPPPAPHAVSRPGTCSPRLARRAHLVWSTRPSRHAMLCGVCTVLRDAHVQQSDHVPGHSHERVRLSIPRQRPRRTCPAVHTVNPA